jgi:hypothetical protein
MSNDEKTTAFQWFKTIAGIVLFCMMTGIHVWFKELPEFLFGFPFLLAGADIHAFMTRGKK